MKFYLFAVLLFFVTNTHAQTKKFDTTVMWGDQGYHVTSANKDLAQNKISLSTVNLRLDIPNPSFNAQGKLTKAITDDFNDDGKPDLALVIFSGDSLNIGSIVGIAATADKKLEPIMFDDIYLDPKNREGYKGYDEFTSLTGTLIRKFPIYLAGDVNGKPTGGVRTIQYKAMQNEGRLKFKILRTFDVKQ